MNGSSTSPLPTSAIVPGSGVSDVTTLCVPSLKLLTCKTLFCVPVMVVVGKADRGTVDITPRKVWTFCANPACAKPCPLW